MKVLYTTSMLYILLFVSKTTPMLYSQRHFLSSLVTSTPQVVSLTPTKSNILRVEPQHIIVYTTPNGS